MKELTGRGKGPDFVPGENGFVKKVNVQPTHTHIFLFVERKVKQYIESKEKYTAQNFHLDKKNEFFSMLLIVVHSTVFCFSSWTPVNYFTLDLFFEGKGCEVSRGLLCWLSKL